MRGSSQCTETRACRSCGAQMQLDGDGLVSWCPSCGEACVFRADLDAAADRRRAGREAEAGGMMAVAGVPETYRSVEPDFELAGKVRRGKGLYLQGGNGTCKTLKAASVVKAFAESGRRARFVRAEDLVGMFRDAMDTGRPESSVYAELDAPELLVIDDLGKENATRFAATVIFNVVDRRYGSGKPLVVTSNLEKHELAARLSAASDASTAQAVVSRLFEMTDKVDFGDDDRRVVA